MTTRRLSLTALLVRDYDEAIAFFTEVLRWQLIEDADRGPGKRWVVVAPDAQASGLLLARAVGPEQEVQIGNQCGGRVFLFQHTDDFWGDYQHMRGHGVRFAEEPREEDYGTVVVFLDLYGNKWDLLQRK